MEDYFLQQNRLFEDKLDLVINGLEARLNKLLSTQDDEQTRDQQHQQQQQQQQQQDDTTGGVVNRNPFSHCSFLTFKRPYIRDFKGFCAPVSVDATQIKQLRGNEDIDFLARNKLWSEKAKEHLKEAVHEHYAKAYLNRLRKQKEQLLGSPALVDNNEDCVQKLRLIDEQSEQVMARKDVRIFVPEDRFDKNIDWCRIAVQLSSPHDAQDCRLMWTNELHWSISNNIWTKDEDICLINAVAKHGKNDWDRVARELNSNRLAWQCCSRYMQRYNSVPMAMDQSDSDKIIEVINLCRIGNFVPWNQVMYFIQSYTLLQVKYQWRKYCSEATNNSAWTHNEDILLIKAVDKFGTKNWQRVADLIPGRNNKSCRERYVMRMRYDRRILGRWRPNEDDKLLRMVERFGTNWALISAHLPERNSHQIRSRYELIKNPNQPRNAAPHSHRRLLRNDAGELVNSLAGRSKAHDERQLDRKLADLFLAYRNVMGKKKIKCISRSAQDELIYQTLVKVLCDKLLDRDCDLGLLGTIIEKAIPMRQGLLPANHSTMLGYKTLELQQDYFSKLANKMDIIQSTNSNENDQRPEIDAKIKKIFISLFLWPTVLSRLKSPQVDLNDCRVGSLIEREKNNLYKIRNIQHLIIKQLK